MKKPIDGFPDYLICDDGRIWSVKSNKFLKLSTHTNKHGNYQYSYQIVWLYANGKKSAHQVSRLVARAFVPNPQNHPWVLHSDDDPFNNHYTNLRWGTPQCNADDRVSRNRQSKGFSNKLTESQVREIRAKYNPRIYTQTMLAKEYNVHINIIQHILARRTWKHI